LLFLQGKSAVKGSLVKASKLVPPKELLPFFSDPPLIGDERREDYEGLFSAIASAAKPADAIAWLFVRDITDLSWEIRRERNLKLLMIRSFHEDVVRGYLTPPAPVSTELVLWPAVDPERDKAVAEAAHDARQWAIDPKARRRIDKELAELGYTAADISVAAFTEAADSVDAIDRRLASYELRRMAALRTVERYSETLARRLENASSKIIDGEFSEAAE
jgi:hypothetical protein